ncbi:MAG: endolytic transglycosylase MltG [Anaerolineales bacterium]|nr:endolytic transglycosylase MltG [Anaerolineales bacterium]MCS7248543.1 endolytic transglycosylase MltG [Anaerolineales bacterium]MDW8162356.1 endolytic transglycosylase MltG [Anaerolineales bacterium]MDW8447983.1 endolytic transglycosylase MltG [Anaerolineales bacterium]
MPNRQKLSFSCFLLALVIALCGVLSTGGLTALSTIHAEVERAFGRPDPSLDYAERTWFELLLFANRETLLTPLNPQAQPKSFLITPGEPTQGILLRLSQEGLIADPDSMQILLQYLGYDTQIQSGEHLLSAGMSPFQIAQALINPANLLIQFNLLAGWRNEEVAEALVASGLNFSVEAFLEAANHPVSFYLPHRSSSETAKSLQGFLMPASYRFRKTASAEELLRQFTQSFDFQVTREIEEKLRHQGLSLYEGVILSSIVQREGVIAEEMPLIASVFLNRLRVQMKLDSDPTVQFALGYDEQQNTWWKNPLSKADLRVDSPYNTYLYPGLPPTPICNPSLEAILAVANAPSSEYFYFRAACDGSGRHLFAKTYAEHLANACP